MEPGTAGNKALASKTTRYKAVSELCIMWSAYMSVCLFVCPLACLKNHMFKFNQIFCTRYFWPCLNAGCYSDGNAICYVLPILWMTSCFYSHKMQLKGRIRDDTYVSSCSPYDGTGAKSTVTDCILFLLLMKRFDRHEESIGHWANRRSAALQIDIP